MSQQLQNATNSGTQIVKRLYKQQWAAAFAEVMDIIRDRWNRTLYQGNQQEAQPTPLLLMWREALESLSPQQMRDGLRLYLSSPQGRFEPSPGDLIALAPEMATDKPRKVKNPDCPECGGSGFRPITVPATATKREHRAVTDCYCARMEYAGEQYPIVAAERQLPAPRPAQNSPTIKADVGGMVDALARKKSMRGPLSEDEIKAKKADAIRRAAEVRS